MNRKGKRYAMKKFPFLKEAILAESAAIFQMFKKSRQKVWKEEEERERDKKIKQNKRSSENGREGDFQ